MAGPAVLLWNHSADMVVEGNTFVNCQREIALGLVSRPTGHDNLRGVVRNNFIYREPGLAGGDVAIGVFDSPGSQVLHNTILVSGAYPNAVEYRFEGTTGAVSPTTSPTARLPGATGASRRSGATTRQPGRSCSSTRRAPT